MNWIKEKQSYKGNWEADKMSGFGTYLYLSELKGKKNLRNFYIGNFKNNNRDGFGVHFYSDSSVYIGYWKEGIKNGRSLYFDNSNYLFVKHFEKNHLKQSTRTEES